MVFGEKSTGLRLPTRFDAGPPFSASLLMLLTWLSNWPLQYFGSSPFWPVPSTAEPLLGTGRLLRTLPVAEVECCGVCKAAAACAAEFCPETGEISAISILSSDFVRRARARSERPALRFRRAAPDTTAGR